MNDIDFKIQQVTNDINKINKVWDGKLDGIKENDDSDYTSVVVGTRVYIAYYLPERA